ncbi:MAG: SDR family oxidoreductase [Novosphingobium sp.]|nr:SDR family oxidoreductase [Novosphingobium sp.]
MQSIVLDRTDGQRRVPGDRRGRRARRGDRARVRGRRAFGRRHPTGAAPRSAGIRETTSRVFTKVWEMACFAGFLAGREAARAMAPRGRGSILFTGATASIRGREGYAAFAAAKAGLRLLAQSLARELGPEGIHVAHVVCDGAIDGVFTRERHDRAEVEALLADDLILKPEDIARSFVWLHNQPRSAWSHEIDLRPWKEAW